MFIRSGYSAQTRSVRSATEHHYRRADVVDGRLQATRGLGAQAEGRGLRGQGRGVEPVELDDVVGHRPRAVAGDDLADALDRRAVAEVAHSDRAACVYDPADLAEVGQRRLVVLRVEGLQRVGQRSGEQAARCEVLAGALQEARA